MSNSQNYNLELPDKGATNWDAKINSNFTKLDSELKNTDNKIGILTDIPEDNLVDAVLNDRSQINNIAKTNANVEVSNTHTGADGKTYTDLPARLNSVDSQLNDIVQQNNKVNNMQPNAFMNNGYLIDAFQVATGRTLSNGTAVIDNTNYKIGNTAVKVTSSGISVSTTCNRAINIDLSDMFLINIELYVLTAKKPTYMTIKFTDNAGGIYSSGNIASLITVNGWNTLRIPKSSFSNTFGTPNLALLTSYEIRIDSPAGYASEVTFARITKNTKGRSAFIFTIDDGYKSAYTLAYPILNSVGYKASLGIYQSAVGTASHMTSSDIQTLYTNGWDVLSHSQTHPDFSSMTYEAIYNEIMNNKNYLSSIGVTDNQDIFIYPVGYSTQGREVVEDLGYKYARGVTETPNTEPILDLLNLTTVTLGMKTLTDIQPKIDDAILTGKIIIFLVHDVIDGTPTGIQTSKQTLTDVVNYLVTNNANVLTLSDYCKSIYKS